MSPGINYGTPALQKRFFQRRKENVRANAPALALDQKRFKDSRDCKPEVYLGGSGFIYTLDKIINKGSNNPGTEW